VKLGRLRTWEEQAENEQEDRKDELNKQILAAYAQLENYQTWEGLEEYIRGEQAKAFVDIMNADGEHLLLARERARVYSKFLQRKTDLEQELERLHSERNGLEE